MNKIKKVNVKLLRTSRYGRIHDIINIDVSDYQLSCLVKYNFVEVRESNPEYTEHNECIIKELKIKKKKGKK